MKVLQNILQAFKLSPKRPSHKIFRSPEYNNTIQKDGFVCLPWLDEHEINTLKTIVARINAKTDLDNVHIKTGFMLSAFNNSEQYKRELYESIYPILKTKINDLLHDHIPLLINVFEKEASKDHNEVDIHQNPSFVNEPEFKSVSIWIPLQDVRKENGTIGVLRGSHDKFFSIRASNMPMVYNDITEKLQNEWFEPVNLNSGSIAVLDDSIIHWSYPNYAEPVRTALQLIMVPRNATHIYYYYNHNDSSPVVDKFSVDPEYFFKFNRNAYPEGLKKIGSVKYKYYQIQEKDIRKKISLKPPSDH